MNAGTRLERSASPRASAAGETVLGRSGTLTSRLWRIAEERCIPLSATIEITLRCNLACVHCYNFDRQRPYTKADAAGELTRDEITDIIDQLADAGCLFLSFTGGEALLHPHLAEFIRHARRRRCAVRVKTNGATLSPAKVEMLGAAGARRVDVSLYGATPETHDAFTLRAGSFDKTVRGIRLARDAGIRVRVNAIVARSNAAEFGSVIALVEGLGCELGVDPFVTARYDGSTSSRDHAVDRTALETLYRGPLKRFLRQPDFDPRRSVQCACARSNCGISATGEVYPCIGAPVPSGNLREQRFADIWSASPQLNRIRALTLDDFTTCQPCPSRPFCKRNSGVVYTNTGTYTGPEAFTCMDAAVARELYGEDEATRQSAD